MAISGRLQIELRGQAQVDHEPREYLIISKGVEHSLLAQMTRNFLLTDPKITVNEGAALGKERYVP